MLNTAELRATSGEASTGSAGRSRALSRGVRICHFHGNPNSYNAAISFQEVGSLISFHTSIYKPAGIRKRYHASLPRNCVTTHPLWESLRLAAARTPLRKWDGQEQRFVDLVCRKFDESSAAALRESDGAVYCYEDSASLTFERAEDLGVRRFYELPIMHYREMARCFESEVARYPELRRFFQSFREPQWKLEQKDKELADADVIIVPATFVRQSIQRSLSPKAQIVVVPYGADISSEVKEWTAADSTGPLRLLFVGSIGPRKGVHVLFEALSKLRPGAFHLTLVGRWELGYREWVEARFPISYEWLGSLNREGVHRAYRSSHVLVFPSLAEGYALVIGEAMASGIPVITTERTGGIDLIDEGKDGWLVPAGDPEAIRASIEFVLDNRHILPEVGAAARRNVERSSWTRYRHLLREGLEAGLPS